MASEAMGHANPGDLSQRSTQRLRRIESRDSQQLLCYLRDDLCDVVCIFVGRVVVELAPEAGIDYALLQTYIGTGGEVSSFPDGTCPKVVGAQLQRDELAFGRAEENGNYLLSTWQLLTTMVRGLPVVHGNQEKQSRCQRTRTILGLIN